MRVARASGIIFFTDFCHKFTRILHYTFTNYFSSYGKITRNMFLKQNVRFQALEVKGKIIGYRNIMKNKEKCTIIYYLIYQF